MREISASANPRQEGTTAVGYTKLFIQYIGNWFLYVEVVSPVSYHKTR